MKKTNPNLLSKSQVKKLEEYSSAINNAYNFDVIGYTDKRSELDLSRIYYETTGFQLTNWNCNHCRLSNWKKIGKLYYESKKYYESNPDEKTTK
jgi:hypothetical protein